MKPEAQRIAIAEWCGLVTKYAGQDPNSLWDDKAICDAMNQPERFPDYLNDLNAMHDAESKLDDVGRRKFAMALHEMTDAGATFGKGLNYWTVIHTNASQRAEALLRTINKLDDSK